MPWFLFSLVFLVASHAAGHNGRVGLAHPAAIRVDGDLTDWPEAARHAVVLTGRGDRPQDRYDFEASFRAAYDTTQGVLYLAVTVEDESIVIDGGTPPTGSSDDDRQDTCEIWLALGHADSATTVLGFVVYGDDRKIHLGTQTLTWDRADVVVRRLDTRHIYEWGIDVSAWNDEGSKPGPDDVLSLDVAIGDRDRDGSFSWTCWGQGVGKHLADRRGDLILGRGPAASGLLSGQLLWAGRDEPVRRGHVYLREEGDGGPPLTLVTDGDGRFAVDLPAGTYHLSPARPMSSSTALDMAAGTRVDRVVRRSRPVGHRRVAGPGAMVAAGSGSHDGPWLNLRVSDGLPTNSVTALLQDNAGNLWIGTRGGGIVRYDGDTFVRYTTANGLAGNEVLAILEGAHGGLWFGTEGGVTRFVKGAFTTFTAVDGLAGDRVITLGDDEHGVLWIGTDGQGLSRFDGDTFHTFTSIDGLPGNTVNAVAHDPAGGLWLATAHGAGRLDEEGFHGYPAANASVARSVSVDRSGRPWFALVRAGVYRLQEGSLRHEPSVMHGLDATAVLHDRRGDLWVGTLSGLHRFHGAHQRWPELGRVHCILEDAEGLVWVGTDQGGLYRFEPKPGRQEAPSH